MSTGVETVNGASVTTTEPMISLVMGTFRRSAELEPMLRSLLAQTNHNFELIVVDQNPDDRVVPLLEPLARAGLTVRHLRQARPNLSAARNLGLDNARGNLIAFPDDDCWYEPDVIELALAHFGASPRSDGIAAHWVELDPRGTRPARALSPEQWRKFKGGDGTSFTLFFRTGKLRSLGGFDETLGTGQWFGCGEETDLIFRLLEAGATINYLPTVHIHHPHDETQNLTRSQCRRNRLYGRGTGALLAKHRLPLWVVGRGLIGPLVQTARSANPAAGLVLASCTILGRVEGLGGWYLWGGRQSQSRAFQPQNSAS